MMQNIELKGITATGIPENTVAGKAMMPAVRRKVVTIQYSERKTEKNNFFKKVKKTGTAHILTACLFLLPHVVSGQQIKSKSIELDDMLSLFQASGYELFSFDITGMLKERYDIVIVSKEYDKDGELASNDILKTRNKRLMTDFPEAQWEKIIDEGRIIDPETKAITHAEKITFGFYPSGNDTTAHIQINVPGFMTMSRVVLKLNGLPMKDSDKKFFSYNTRPFKIKAFQEDTFIPLILFGSMWYDEKFNVYRFCGEREIDPDMSSEILGNIPHYYVLGLTFQKNRQ